MFNKKILSQIKPILGFLFGTTIFPFRLAQESKVVVVSSIGNRARVLVVFLHYVAYFVFTGVQLVRVEAEVRARGQTEGQGQEGQVMTRMWLLFMLAGNFICGECLVALWLKRVEIVEHFNAGTKLDGELYGTSR
jgi:hypothetical protein